MAGCCQKPPNIQRLTLLRSYVLGTDFSATHDLFYSVDTCKLSTLRYTFKGKKALSSPVYLLFQISLDTAELSA